MSSKLGQIKPWAAKLGVLDQLKTIYLNYLKILASSQVSDRCRFGYLSRVVFKERNHERKNKLVFFDFGHVTRFTNMAAAIVRY